jgi:hypothetical protein
MVDANFIICMGELTSIVINQGLKEYMQYQKNVIEDGRRDELISERVKKFSSQLYKSMSRDTTPILEENTISLTNIYPDSDKSEEENKDSIADSIIDSIPKIS